MKVAIIESVPATPHLETAGEIALRLKKKKLEVSFCWVGFDLKWNDWELGFLPKLLGGSYEKKLLEFTNILKSKGINIDRLYFSINKKKIFDWSNNFKGNLKELKKYSYDNKLLGAGVASSIISHLKNENVDTKKNETKIQNLLYSSAIVYERTKKYLKLNKPDKIFTFNNRFATCYPIICAAEKLKIPIIRHERGCNIFKYELFEKDVHDLDLTRKNFDFYWKKNKNKNKKSKARNYFIKKLKGQNNENFLFSNFTSNQIKDHLPYLPNNKRIVTFFTSRDYEKASIVNMKFNQFKNFKKFKKIVDTFDDIHLIIRVHPSFADKKSYDDDEWKKFSGKNTTVIQSFENYDSYSLLFKSDIVVAYTSSIIVESAFFNKPSISSGKFWWSGLNIVEEPNNLNELKKILKKNYYFKKKNKIGCMKIANYFLNYGINFKFYKPLTSTTGKFLGEYLTWKPNYFIFFEKIGFFKLIKNKLFNKS